MELRKLTLLLMSALMAGASTAMAEELSLKVTLNDGKVRTFTLAEKPVVTFGATDMKITAPGAEVTYARADVRNITFVDNSTLSVADRLTENYYYDGSEFRCDGSDIAAYDMNGRLVLTGRGRVSTASLPNGIYVIKANNTTIKIIK